jgi:Yip1 domain
MLANSALEVVMAVAPLPPVSSSPADAAPLSQGARIVNTFIAPSKTFSDLRRNASWWAPFLLMVIISTVFVYTASQKIGFRKIMENQMQAQPKAQERLDKLPADQREAQLQAGAKFTAVISYAFPVVTLIIWVIIAAAIFGTLKFAGGGDVPFKVALAVVIYAALPLMVKTLLALLSVVAGMSPDSFSFQNPVATNPGYFLNPADSVFLYNLASSVDIFLIWTLVLTAVGFTCVSKVKRGTSFAVVFGWWAVFTLLSAGLAGAFS